MALKLHNLIFAILFVCFLSLNLAVPPPDRLECLAEEKCTFDPPLVWATDGVHCKVFYNACHLRDHNCERLKTGQAFLTTVSREQCISSCRRGCTKESNPVCTDWKGVLVTFQNPCLWSQRMCKNKEAYIFKSQGRCPAQKQ